nr:Ycf34 [Erythrotrichia welwitschii]
MCICINCYHVMNCSTYYSVEKQHKKQKEKINSSFVAESPIIKVNIIRYNNTSELDWDVIECISFVEAPGKWLFSKTPSRI